jgi:hypothetical protein
MHPIVRLVPFLSYTWVPNLYLLPHHAYICHTVSIGESIALEGKGEYMYVEGRVLTTSGDPVPGAVIETWEVDSTGKQSFEVQQFAFPSA